MEYPLAWWLVAMTKDHSLVSHIEMKLDR